MDNRTLEYFRWALGRVEAELTRLTPTAKDYREIIKKEEARRAAKAKKAKERNAKASPQAR